MSWQLVPRCHKGIQQLMLCRQSLEARYDFLQHKLRDVLRDIKALPRSRRRETQLLLNRAKHLRAVSDNVFQTALTVDGLVDSIVTLGVMKAAEKALAVSVAVECAASLMDRVSLAVADAQDCSQALAAPVVEEFADELSCEPDVLEALPDVPAITPTLDTPAAPRQAALIAC
jgi:hypothetical protein